MINFFRTLQEGDIIQYKLLIINFDIEWGNLELLKYYMTDH